MKCANCGREVPNTAKVCGHCGHRLKASAPVPGTISQPVSSQRGMPGWAWGLIGGLVILAGFAIFVVIWLLATAAPASPNSPQVSVPTGAFATAVPHTATFAPTQTLSPTATIPPSPVPMPSIGTYPNVDTVWNDMVNQRLPRLRAILDQRYDADEGLLSGLDHFAYTVRVSQSQSVIWDSGWCAANENILRQNVSNMIFEFSINDQPIPQSNFGTKYVPNGSHYCFYLFAVLKGWPLGEQVLAEIQTFKTDINDGVTNGTFPSGRKVIQYLITVTP